MFPEPHTPSTPLRLARLRSLLSQREVARASLVSQPYYSKIERGETRPSAVTAQRIATVVRTTVEMLWPDLERSRRRVARRPVAPKEPVSA